MEEAVYEFRVDGEDRETRIIFCDFDPEGDSPNPIVFATAVVTEVPMPAHPQKFFSKISDLETFLNTNDLCKTYLRGINMHPLSWLHIQETFFTKVFANRYGRTMNEFRRWEVIDEHQDVLVITVYEYNSSGDEPVGSVVLTVMFNDAV